MEKLQTRAGDILNFIKLHGRKTGALGGVALTAWAAPGLAIAQEASDPVPAPEVELCEGREATNVGTDFSDVIVGTSGPDVIHAGAGDDNITGGEGNDIICGGEGNDRISGSYGNDRLFGEGGNDTITGSWGSDWIIGEAGNDNLLGNEDNDTVKGGSGHDRVHGGYGNDQIYGGEGNDTLTGYDGTDVFYGGLGTDNIDGGKGVDRFSDFNREAQDIILDNTDGALVPRTYSINYGPVYGSRANITFDDCPRTLASMKSVVVAAKRLGIGLVLAPTGNCIRSGKFDVQFALKYGQYVINHSISHPNLARLSLSGVRTQLGRPGVVTNYGRPPFGSINSTVLRGYASVGMRPWKWTKDTNDWRGKTRTQVINYVISNTRPRDTVLAHMQHQGFNDAALRAMKSGLDRRGIKLCRPFPTPDGSSISIAPVRIPASGVPC